MNILGEENTRASRWGNPSLSGSLILVLLSIYWFSSSYFDVKGEFSPLDTKIVFASTAIIVIFEAAFIFASDYLFKSPLFTTFLCAVLLVLNAYSLNLILNADFMSMTWVSIAAILAAGIFVAFTIVRMATESRISRWIVLVVGAGLAASPALADYISSSLRYQRSAAKNPSEIITNVDFVMKPNVYFVGFESMAAPAVLAKNLEYKTSPMPEMLARNGFRVFRNMFTEDAPTVASLSNLLALDYQYQIKAKSSNWPLFRGDMPSPLLEIFKHNGYETSTIYYLSFFGKEAGPFVDRYLYNEVFSICTFMAPREVVFSFFGICNLSDLPFWNEKPRIAGNAFHFALENIKQVASHAKPQFVLAHAPPMGHTPKVFTGSQKEIDTFRVSYADASNRAAKNLDDLVNVIRQNDPGAILFVFGDHGVWLSRRTPFKKQKTFFVQDRYAVLGAIYPKDACAASFDNPISKDFTTIEQVARMLIRCLAGGIDAFTPTYDHKLNVLGPDVRFEDYLYE